MRTFLTLPAALFALTVLMGVAGAFEPGGTATGNSFSWRPGAVFRDCQTCPELTVLPAGAFLMGSQTRFKREMPAHRVAIPRSFALGRYEVTFDEWKACSDDGVCAADPDDHKWGRGRRPIINITFDQIKTYLAWLSSKTGHTYRLPSEAEWEYAARGGTKTKYSWGDEIGKEKANCRDCGPEISHQTSPVGTFEPNPFGLYDMHGNVWEWVEDCWNPSYENAPADGSARLDGDCASRITRSGSWYYFSKNLRSAARSKFPARAYSYGIGFRVLREGP